MRDVTYYRSRAQDEWALAERAKDDRVRIVHRALADAYEARAQACAVRRIAVSNPGERGNFRSFVLRGKDEDGLDL